MPNATENKYGFEVSDEYQNKAMEGRLKTTANQSFFSTV
jgi:hypothetical protein